MSYSCSNEQAALAHLESIIYDPHESDSSPHVPNGMDGEEGALSGSDEDRLKD